MTASDAGEGHDRPVTPASSNEEPSLSYGNIYTPHAGSMIIHVQRESGLQSRMIVLGPRRVRFLRFLTSRSGKVAVAVAGVVMLGIIAEAARVPALVQRNSRMEHTAERLDSLERSLGQLQQRYDQVRTMMGADSTAAAAGSRSLQRAVAPLPASPLRVGTPVSPDLGAQAASAAPATADATGPGTATAVDDPAQPEAAPSLPARRRRRHVVAAAPPPSDSVAPPDTGAAPSAQAEPQ